jgi:asparagine synthase (glutamine-hydrolysing)
MESSNLPVRARSRLKTAAKGIRRRVGRWRLQRLALQQPEIGRCIEAVLAQRLTYLTAEALWDLALGVREVEANAVEGLILEAGCALGGSAIVLARSKNPERELRVFDVFGQIPRPSDKDGKDVWERYELIETGKSTGIKGDAYYGYQEDLLGHVRQTFAEFGLPVESHRVRLIQGLYSETLRLDGPVALAHIDCDWYQSVLDCLREIEPRLAISGRLVIDDYEAWSGCRRAVDEYFAGAARGSYRFVRKSRLHIVKVR